MTSDRTEIARPLYEQSQWVRDIERRLDVLESGLPRRQGIGSDYGRLSQGDLGTLHREVKHQPRSAEVAAEVAKRVFPRDLPTADTRGDSATGYHHLHIEPVAYRKTIGEQEHVAVARDVGTVKALKADGWKL